MPALSRFLLTLFIVFIAGCDEGPAEKPLDYRAAPPATAPAAYRLAVHPLHNPVLLAEAYQPLIDFLNQQLGDLSFELEASRDYAAYEQKYLDRRPDFLLPNPWQTLQAIEHGYRVIAMVGDAQDFRGLFVVRRDSGIRRPADLRGKTVSYPSPTALAACIMPQRFLHAQGIDINKDIRNDYVGSQESSIMHVYLGLSAAGATWPLPWRVFQRDHPEEAAKLEVVWETPHLLNNSLMVRDDVPPEVVQRVRAVVLDLARSEAGRKVLRSMQVARFHPADNATYEPVRDYIRQFEALVRPVGGG